MITKIKRIKTREFIAKVALEAIEKDQYLSHPQLAELLNSKGFTTSKGVPYSNTATLVTKIYNYYKNEELDFIKASAIAQVFIDKYGHNIIHK